MSEIGIIFAVFLAAVALFLGGLFLYAWRRRDRRPPQPTRPYREWKDD
jgi:uncharacterized SAM-binding protein YcdF (DUF218 family)